MAKTSGVQRRALVLAPLGAVMAAALSACGGGGDESTDADQPSLEGLESRAIKPVLTPQQKAMHMADFILSLQTVEGAIKDSPGAKRINEDSNMEYALMGLAAAYNYSKDQKYLEGLRRGVEWLGTHITMDGEWAGSFPLFFTSAAGAGNYNTRGVDATSSLFVYSVYLHQRLSGTTTLRDKYEAPIRAALNFLDTRNTCSDGFSLSSWVKGKRWDYEYSADQMDVYLGWEGARRMFPSDTHFTERAAFYRANVPVTFFMKAQGRYSIGRDHGGKLETGFDGFDGIFPNGYLPWTVGPDALNTQALQWMESTKKADGSMVPPGQTTAYALTAAIYLCGCAATGRTPDPACVNWLCGPIFDQATGGVNDTTNDNTKYSNVAGFSVVGLLGFLPFA